MRLNFKKVLKLLYCIALTTAILFSIAGCRDSQAPASDSSSEEIKTDTVEAEDTADTVEVKAEPKEEKPATETKKEETPKPKEKEKTVCIACHGTGEVEQYFTNDPLEEPHWETCALCGGKGYYFE